ncbi:MAG: N-acetylmuramoyl-L-alanine amidase family protein [Paraclostridium sp.]
MTKKVFLDPGHGGSDSGAIGVNNSYEKDIVLSITKKVEQLLKKQGIDVRLARDTDKTVSLKERTDTANAWNADCFVSIHCNAFNKKAKGLEVFSLNESTSNLAKDVLEGILNEKAYTLNRGVKFARFYVIKNSKLRACLVETAFIDNEEDYKILIEKQD